jgi:hypothetical protein
LLKQRDEQERLLRAGEKKDEPPINYMEKEKQ